MFQLVAITEMGHNIRGRYGDCWKGTAEFFTSFYPNTKNVSWRQW